MFGAIRASYERGWPPLGLATVAVAEGYAIALLLAMPLVVQGHEPRVWNNRMFVWLAAADWLSAGAYFAVGLAIRRLHPVSDTPYAMLSVGLTVWVFWLGGAMRIAESQALLDGNVFLMAVFRSVGGLLTLFLAFAAPAALASALRLRAEAARRLATATTRIEAAKGGGDA